MKDAVLIFLKEVSRKQNILLAWLHRPEYTAAEAK
jgi:hypothetical protein